MTMVLALVVASLVVTVVTAIALSDLLRTGDSSTLARENPHPNVTPRFFAKDIPDPVPAGRASRVPVEVVVLEIERHVRRERAVAESFHLSPTPQALHVRGASPLLH